jgi:anhydro-N-acetylmuramic acid kinase
LQGKVDDTVLAALYRDAIAYHGRDFFKAPPSKALDIGDLRLVPELERLSLPDACATLAAFTADTIVQSLDHINTLPIPKTWILAGGGWFNPVIKQQLAERLQQKLGSAVKLVTADDIGWHCQALEAQLFAYFAIRSLQGKPLSVPGTTGVKHPASGGRLHLPADQQSANTALLR